MTFLCLQEETEEDSDLSDYGDDMDGRKDALAEPCFMLIGEIFELRGSKQASLLLLSGICWVSGAHTHI